MTRKETPLVAALFALLAVLWTYPLVLYLGDGLPGGMGDELLNTWILAWDADRLRHGLAGWWDAPIFFPYTRTLAYSEHLLGIALFVSPVQWATGNPLVAYNVAFIGSYALALLGMYLLTRELTGRGDAAVIAALIFAFAPYRASKIPHLQVLMSGWMPIALWAMTRYFSTRSPWALGGVAAAFLLQALSNNYFLYFQLLPLSLVAIDGLRRAGAQWRDRLRGLAVAGAAVMVPLAPIAFVYRQVQIEQGFTRGLSEIVSYSADLGSYLAAIPEVALWAWLPGFRKPEGFLFPGLTVLVLAAVAMWPARADRQQLSGLRDVPGFLRALWRVGTPVVGAGALIGAALFGYSGVWLLVTTTALLLRAVLPWPRSRCGLYGAIALFAFVLSLGPEPTSWGRPIMPMGPYMWLWQTVPGLGGLRVPARLATIVSLALAVIAAFGAARLLAGRSPVVRRALVGVLLAGALADGFAGPIRVVSARQPGGDEVRATSEWIRARPDGAVLLLPFDGTAMPQYFREQQVMAIDRARPLVNGYRGHMPGMHRAFEGDPSILSEPGRAARALRVLHSLGVRYVVIDGRQYVQPAEVSKLAGAIGEAVPVVERQVFGTTHVLRLSANAPALTVTEQGSAPIASTALRVSASSNSRRASLAIDGNPVSRWLSGQRQSGDERFIVELDRPRDVALVRLQVSPRSEGDYPRWLRIESIAPDGTVVVLFDDDVVESLLMGLTHEPRYGPVEIALPPNRTTRLVLRQTGRAERRFWSINELALRER